jgi:phage/plasmid-associated DNA primase
MRFSPKFITRSSRGQGQADHGLGHDQCPHALRASALQLQATVQDLALHQQHAGDPWQRGRDLGPYSRIPFEQRFDGPNADTNLPAKLREELSGVLAWAVKGCVDWGKHGLGTAKAVEAAVQDYREEMDTFALFLADTCDIGPNYFVTSKALHKAYETWADDMGEKPLSQKKLSNELRTRGFLTDRGTRGERGWSGLTVKSGGDGGSFDTSDSEPPNSEKSRKSQENDRQNPHVQNGFDSSDASRGNFSLESPHVEKSYTEPSKPSNRFQRWGF